MKINKFKFKDNSREWSLENLELARLTLIVGASGVGKTQILRAITSMGAIASGKSMNGIEWLINFTTTDEIIYEWEGKFETKDTSIFIEIEDDDDDESNKKEKPNLVYEILKRNGNTIIERNEDKIRFIGVETIRLSQQESVVNLLKEEDLVKTAFLNLSKITLSDQSNSMEHPSMLRISLINASKLAKKLNTTEKIQESGFDTTLKLYLISKTDKKLFNTIKQRFISIFPQVEDIKIAPLNIKDNNVPDFFKDYPFIQIREEGVEKWIEQSRISSGMFRTLMHISDLYLCSEGTVFLIDEFENSLGINCIDELTNDILRSKRKLQFILTSHHPYIINSIGYDNWKLITRKSGIISAHDVSEFNFGKSKHDAFMQLMQLDEYQTGKTS